jgi:hypothetical protein
MIKSRVGRAEMSTAFSVCGEFRCGGAKIMIGAHFWIRLLILLGGKSGRGQREIPQLADTQDTTSPF